MAGTTNMEGGVLCRGLGDLPEDCMTAILRLTTPKDVARLACVNRVFRDASNADSVWQMMLPSCCDDILAQAPVGAGVSTTSKKQVFDYLASRVLLENGTQDFWLDRETGGVCRSIGPRGLVIVWGDDDRYWSWAEKCDGARFADTAYLKQVCWLEIRGNLKCSLPPGTYKLSWRLAISKSNLGGFYNTPVIFSFEAAGNEPVYFEKDLSTLNGSERRSLFRRSRSRLRYNRNSADNEWFEVSVGEFTIDNGDEQPVDINFSMFQVDGGAWKSGIVLDSVLIRPTTVRSGFTPGCQEQEVKDMSHSLGL